MCVRIEWLFLQLQIIRLRTIIVLKPHASAVVTVAALAAAALTGGVHGAAVPLVALAGAAVLVGAYLRGRVN
jgi:hypothetical protein